MSTSIANARAKLAAALAVSGIAAMLSSGDAAAADKLRIGLAVANDISNIALFAAQEADTFKKHDLDLEVTVFRGGGAAQEALAAGAVATVASSVPGVAAAQNRGVPQLCIGVLRHNSAGWYMMVDYNSKMSKPEDLAGKKVAITSKGGTTDFYAQWAAEKGGAKIDTIPLGSTAAMAGALKAGQVDAAILYNDFAYNLMQAKAVKPLVDYGEALPPHTPGCWVSTRNIVDANRAGLEKFFAGMADASAKFRGDKTFAYEVLNKLYKNIEPGMRDFLYGIAMRYLEGDASATAQEMETTVKMSNVDYKKPYTELFTNELVKK